VSKEATEDAARQAVDFAVARTRRDREEAYMLLSSIGEAARRNLAASGHSDTADRTEEPSRAARWRGELP